jgi:hypothetical protein
MRLVLLLYICSVFIFTNAALFGSDPDLQVFILPHSHIDQGWLRTVGEYRDETLGILRSVIDNMMNAPHRKYVWGDVYVR